MDFAEINTIRRQYIQGEWKQLLDSVAIQGLRGWKNEVVHFRYPICAIVGENGTGKSTILKAAACIYENKVPDTKFYPSDFFRTTVWDDVSGVTISYQFRQGDKADTQTITKRSERWRIPPKRPQRHVYFLDISRTLPLDATAGYAKIAKQGSIETSSVQIDDKFRDELSYILGKNYTDARFATSDIDNNKGVGILKRDGIDFSQFHQGAGEDTSLDLIKYLQEIPSNSLLLIDEIEASLHPRAQRRLMSALFRLCRQKRIQVILSTHSPYILEEMPEEARIMILPGNGVRNIVYGASPEFCMSKIDDIQHPELYVYVEDREAETFVKEIVSTDPEGHDLLSRIQIVPVGPANAVALMGQLAKSGRLPHKGLAILDGDQSPDANCIMLPGGIAPEKLVFRDLKEIGWRGLSERFGIGPGNLFSYLDDAILDPDHHKWTAKVGDCIFKSKMFVWETLCNQWAKECLTPEHSAPLLQAIKAAL